MNLEESLNQRLEILLSSGVITQSISDYSKTVVKLLINQNRRQTVTGLLCLLRIWPWPGRGS